MNSLFRIENISFKFFGRDQSLFKNFSLVVPDQKLTVIMGASGSGKSTLLRFLNRLIDPQSGDIFYKEKNNKDMSVLELRKKVSLVTPLKFFPDENVQDYLLYGPQLHHVDVNKNDLLNLIKKLWLNESVLSRKVNELSSGELQRINLLRAMLNQPEVLLLDEPTANLDEDTTKQMEMVVLDLVHKSNLYLVWVTHDKSQAARLGVSPIEMSKGY